MDLEALQRLGGQDILVNYGEGVLILDFGNSVFEFLTDLDRRARYLKIMDIVDKASDIKVVLSLADPKSLGDEAYDGYLRKIFGTDIDLADLGNS